MHTSHEVDGYIHLARSLDHFSMALACVQFFNSSQDLFPDDDPSHAQESQVWPLVRPLGR